MPRASIVPEITALLEPYLEACMSRWNASPEHAREPTLPTTGDAKVNVRALTMALGLRLSQEQHFYRHPTLAMMVNAVADAQGLHLIGSRAQLDASDAAVRKRVNRLRDDGNQLARALAEREAVIEGLRSELVAMREQLSLQDDSGMVLRTKSPS